MKGEKVRGMSKLTLYHGSKSGLEGPIRLTSRNRLSLDFGQGFYMGDEPTQPRTLICSGASPTLYTLSFDLDGLKVHHFEPDEEWAMFIALNRGKLEKYRNRPFYRRLLDIRKHNDVIFGKIANDKMFGVLTNFFDGVIGLTALVESLAALNIGNQYCALTEKAFSHIKIERTKKYSARECELLKARHERQLGYALKVADRICKLKRREGQSFDEIIERLEKEAK